MNEKEGLSRQSALLVWLSPNYPVGAYAYSHGLEWAVETGRVADRLSAQAYVAASISQGPGFADLVFLAAAWRNPSPPAARKLAAVARAFRGTAELALETSSQGAAFAATTRAAWPGTALDGLQPEDCADLPYPIAVGLALSGRVALREALEAYAVAFAGALTSSAIRLVPLGQTDGQRALSALTPVLRLAAERAMSTGVDDLGSAALVLEIGSMRHETQQTRLFRS